ncbi:MAG: hypothetical protein Q9157_004804 [Trypethelium eluteriae]
MSTNLSTLLEALKQWESMVEQDAQRDPEIIQLMEEFKIKQLSQGYGSTSRVYDLLHQASLDSNPITPDASRMRINVARCFQALTAEYTSGILAFIPSGFKNTIHHWGVDRIKYSASKIKKELPGLGTILAATEQDVLESIKFGQLLYETHIKGTFAISSLVVNFPNMVNNEGYPLPQQYPFGRPYLRYDANKKLHVRFMGVYGLYGEKAFATEYKSLTMPGYYPLKDDYLAEQVDQLPEEHLDLDPNTRGVSSAEEKAFHERIDRFGEVVDCSEIFKITKSLKDQSLLAEESEESQGVGRGGTQHKMTTKIH